MTRIRSYTTSWDLTEYTAQDSFANDVEHKLLASLVPGSGSARKVTQCRLNPRDGSNGFLRQALNSRRAKGVH